MNYKSNLTYSMQENDSCNMPKAKNYYTLCNMPNIIIVLGGRQLFSNPLATLPVAVCDKCRDWQVFGLHEGGHPLQTFQLAPRCVFHLIALK